MLDRSKILPRYFVAMTEHSMCQPGNPFLADRRQDPIPGHLIGLLLRHPGQADAGVKPRGLIKSFDFFPRLRHGFVFPVPAPTVPKRS